jgi:hypothetical protein
MAKRKKRATVGKRKSTARSKVRKGLVSAPGKAAKRTAAKSKPRERLAEAMPKRPAAKQVARKRTRPAQKPPSTSPSKASLSM